ncbi:MAG: hypothetical protein JST14_06005 [Bacteroidetes bacterium]|nr:hypothetical protein [Bacteroidota bacterium]
MKAGTAAAGVLLAEAVIIAVVFALHHETIASLQLVTRYSGRLSLLLFLFIIVLYPRNISVLQHILSRKFLLVFALAHFIHLVELLVYLNAADIFPAPYRLAGGFMAYLIIFVAPWVQYQMDEQRFSSEVFNRFMVVYQIYVWFVFLMTYVGRVAGGLPGGGSADLLHFVLLGFVSAIMVFKLIQIIKRK